MKILLYGSVADYKAEKISKLIKEKCSEKGCNDVQVVPLNAFKGDLSEAIQKENPDVVVHLGTKSLDIDVPVVNGLSLIYPQMGIDKTITEILSHA